MSIGDILIRLRRVRRQSQESLAVEIGISSSYLSLLENRKRPVARQILQVLAEHLDVPASYLLIEDLDLNRLCERHQRIVRQMRREIVEPALRRILDAENYGATNPHGSADPAREMFIQSAAGK